MFLSSSNLRVYLALGVTDMRKAINGLSILVENNFDLPVFSGHLFVFCNRRKDIVKILYWDRNGFCLWQKRLEKHRFKWPDSRAEVLEVDHCQLQWLIDGLDIRKLQGHEKLAYKTVS